MRNREVPRRRAGGIRASVPALAGALAGVLLVLVSPPADTQAAQAGYKAAVESTASVEGAVPILLKQAEEIEAELAQTPGDEGLLANLTRTRINAANAMIADGAGDSKGGSEETKQQLVLAAAAWSEYLTVAKKPSPGLAILVAPALVQLAELSSSSREALKNVKAAAATQKIVVESRPGEVA
jgi:hypothetical protein